MENGVSVCAERMKRECPPNRKWKHSSNNEKPQIVRGSY